MSVGVNIIPERRSNISCLRSCTSEEAQAASSLFQNQDNNLRRAHNVALTAYGS